MSNKIVKRSYGMLLFRKNPSTAQVELLLIQKRCTYAYSDFVNGRYSKNDNSILNLLNYMTREEKIVILSLNFNYMWYHCYMYTSQLLDEHCETNFGFMKKKKKFTRMFVADGGRRIRSLINKSRSKMRIWDLPKGRKEQDEYDVNCAIREIKEEVDLGPKKYKFLWNMKPMHFTHEDCGVRYYCKFYIGVVTCPKVSRNDIKLNLLNPHQTMEILSSKWVTKFEASLLLNKFVFQKVDCYFERVKKDLKTEIDRVLNTHTKQTSNNDENIRKCFQSKASQVKGLEDIMSPRGSISTQFRKFGETSSPPSLGKHNNIQPIRSYTIMKDDEPKENVTKSRSYTK
jgi:8-oxo-dGTP pyrophosphatase MutT (NUDIX family)